MASTDAKAIPVKNVALRITFPIFDADGDLVTGASALDSEVSIDGGTFADCTNEATEIATASGMYYLDLTSSEMNGDTIAVIVKTSTAGAKTTPIVMYTAARSVNDLAFPTTTGRSMDVDASGGVEVGSFQSGALTSGAFAAGAINAAAIATDAITAAKIAADAIGASELAADAVTEIQSGLATSAALATVQADTDDIQTRLPTALVGGRMDSSVGAMAANVLTASAIATDAITAGKIAADAIGASELAADAVTEIQSGLATSAALATVQADTDDIQTRLPAALVSGRMDSSVGAMAAGVVTAAAVATGAIDADALATDAVTEIVNGVWDEAIASHLGAGSTGAKLNSAAAAGDPWATALPGAYGAGTAGKIVGDNINAPISGIPTATQNADTLLTRALSAVEGSATVRSLAWAIAKLTNRVYLSGSTLHITKTDDSTDVFTQAVATDASQAPVVGIDTN